MFHKKLFNVEGKTALVTGGNSGIGEAMARVLGLEGAKVILAARRKDALKDSVDKMKAEGIKAKCISADISTAKGAYKLAKQALEMADIDIIINAAGVNLREPFLEVSPKTWDTQIGLHLGAPFYLTQKIAPSMAKRKWGRIINVGSLQSVRAFANSAPYGAAKGGIMQLTRAMAQEWSSKGINCNAIGPGFFPTALTAPVYENPKLLKQNADMTCIGRNGELEDLVGLTLFLASDASAYITGQTIMIDGGFTSK